MDHIDGTTFHERRGAVVNAFSYSIDYVLLDAEGDVETPSLFGRNRRALMSLWDRDHGGPPKAGRGAVWVREVLAALNVPAPATIELLAQPRVLGHVFNPVAFWLMRDGDGALTSVIAEVSNTFGDRHSYLCHHPDHRPITREDTLEAAKCFHVSPFQDVSGGYRFRFDIAADRVGVWIDYGAGDDGVYATLTGRRRALGAGGILRACLRRPFGSRRVLALIHWQAIRLWWKGAGYRPRPEPPEHSVSR